MEKNNLLPKLNIRHKTTFEEENSGALRGKLKGFVLKEDKSNSSSNVYNLRTENLLSTRSARPKTRIEVVIEYLYEILHKFESYNNDEYVFKTECVIKEIKSNKMYKYEQQLDPMQNKLLNLYSPDFYKEEKDEDSEKNLCISENEVEEEADEEESLKTKGNEMLIQVDKPKESSSTSKNSFKLQINYSEPTKDQNQKTQVDNEKQLEVINTDDVDQKDLKIISNKKSSIDSQPSTNLIVNKIKDERRKSNICKKFYRTQSISIEKLIKPLDYNKFGVYFDVFGYADEVGRIFLLKQVTLAAFSYKEVYSFLKSSYLENYVEELRMGYTCESNAYYHNVS